MKTRDKRKSAVGRNTLLLAVCLVAALVSYDAGDISSPVYALTIWLTLLLSVPLAVIVHEAGHLAMGLLTGFHFVSFRVGSFMLIRCGSKLHKRRLQLPGTAGQCLMAPPERFEDMGSQTLYHFGGVLFNLLICVLAGLCAHFAESAIVRLALHTFAVYNAITALLNIIPWQRSMNDGRNLLLMKREPRYRYDMWRELRIAVLQGEGLRLSEMPAELFDETGEGTDAERLRYALALALDRHDFGRARGLAERFMALEGIAPLMQNIVQEELLFIELIGENRADEVNRLLTSQLKKHLDTAKGFLAAYRVQYALSLLHDRDEYAAADCREAFESTAATWPYSGDAALERELLALADDADIAVREKEHGEEA